MDLTSILATLTKFFVLGFIIYLIYRAGWHEKIFKLVSHWIGLTKDYKQRQSQNKRVMRFMQRQNKHNRQI